MTDGPMIARVRRIGVRSTFLLFLVIFGVVGLLVGTGLAVLSSLQLGPEAAETFLDRLGWWAPPLCFLAYGLLGGISAAITAVLYNMGAAVTGGVKVTLDTAHEVEVVPYHHRERVETDAGAADGGDGGGEEGRDGEGGNLSESPEAAGSV